MAKKIKTLDGFSNTSDSSGFRTRDAGALSDRTLRVAALTHSRARNTTSVLMAVAVN